MSLSIVILAAGEGKRMRSNLPKVLHTLAGIPLLEHVVNTAQQLKPKNIYVVYGKTRDVVKERLHNLSVTWVPQEKTLGTGHAVMQTLPFLKKDEDVLILYGDVPLINLNTLKNLIERTPKNSIGWLTTHVENPTGLGRIIRNTNGELVEIIEERDATKKQKQIKEINPGICLLPAKFLKKYLPNLTDNNAQHEYYLTDIFTMAIADGQKITTATTNSEIEIAGVNDNMQLAKLERAYQQQLAEKLMKSGLTLRDPNRFDVRGNLTFGKDVIIDVNVIIEGEVTIGNDCYIGPNVYLRDVTIANNVEINANTVIRSATIANDCMIGPFARIRPETKLDKGVKIGNFVEIKKSQIGERSKVNHLSYIGDTTMGEDVNVGAGSITCNYDGVNKHKTIIEDNVFLGSNTKMVAPVTIGENATVGAGSTITSDVPPNDLTLARAKQITIEGWKRPDKK